MDPFDVHKYAMRLNLALTHLQVRSRDAVDKKRTMSYSNFIAIEAS